jgi:hypothetical protein
MANALPGGLTNVLALRRDVEPGAGGYRWNRPFRHISKMAVHHRKIQL